MPLAGQEAPESCGSRVQNEVHRSDMCIFFSKGFWNPAGVLHGSVVKGTVIDKLNDI